MVCVSIIVPVYNSEKYIARCVDSILAQTYQEFELLLIDDGSKDNSVVLCDQYASADDRVRVIHKENSGVAATRNVGIQEARGDYISFVDSDDYIKPDMLEKLVKKATAYKSDIVMCNYFIDSAGKITMAQMKYNEVYDGVDSVKKGLLYFYYTDYHVGLYSLCNKLIKKSIYHTNNICFDSSLKRGEDAWFIFQCLKYCHRVDYIPEALYYYFQNDNSIMHNTYEDQYEKWVDMRKRLLKENKMLQFEVDYGLFYKEFLYKVAIYCKDAIDAGKSGKVKKILQDDFYKQSVKYVNTLPLHIKVIHWSAIIHPSIAVILIRLWNKQK